jgi:transposase InsO family protein
MALIDRCAGLRPRPVTTPTAAAKHALRALARRWLTLAEEINAMIEAFWSRMRVELLDRHRWRTRLELANAIFEYLEIFHNRRRRHSAQGWLTPLEKDKKQAEPDH